MLKVLIVDNSIPDAQRFQKILAKEGAEVVICLSGADGETVIDSAPEGFAAAVILWDLVGQISGADLILKCRRLWPDIPVVVVSEALDASMATRAYAFGAQDFLAKPLDSERITSCLRSLLAAKDPLSPSVAELRKRVLGQSREILTTLKELAMVIPHGDSSVLLIGESGTGKELFARALHELGPRRAALLLAVNVAGLPSTLIESNLFGYERGAFTGANERHIGFFEEAGNGTIFLDEIGELEPSLQTKLLRVIQEKKFRRLNGKQDLNFKARLVCATNRDLAVAVNESSFRSDLFHRIAEVTIHIPPLRKRKGDVDLLLNHFLDRNKKKPNVRFARETLKILRSYDFGGNVRELENIVTSALIQSEEADVVLPRHLPLTNMGGLLNAAGQAERSPVSTQENNGAPPRHTLIEELIHTLDPNCFEMRYHEAVQLYNEAFDRIYLRRQLERSRHNVTQAARSAGIDTKTFRRRWKACGLPPLSGEEEDDAK